MQRRDRDMPWSLKGVRPEVREMAKTAAAEAGLPIGTWLSAAIRTIGESELRGAATRGTPARPTPETGFATAGADGHEPLDRAAARDGDD